MKSEKFALVYSSVVCVCNAQNNKYVEMKILRNMFLNSFLPQTYPENITKELKKHKKYEIRCGLTVDTPVLNESTYLSICKYSMDYKMDLTHIVLMGVEITVNNLHFLEELSKICNTLILIDNSASTNMIINKSKTYKYFNNLIHIVDERYTVLALLLFLSELNCSLDIKRQVFVKELYRTNNNEVYIIYSNQNKLYKYKSEYLYLLENELIYKNKLINKPKHANNIH